MLGHCAGASATIWHSRAASSIAPASREAWQQHREFLAAETAEAVRVPQVVPDQVGKVTEHRIAGARDRIRR